MMRLRYPLLVVSVLASLLLLTGRGMAAPVTDDSIHVTQAQLKAWGVNTSELVLGGVSDDGTMALASHKETDPKEIHKGHNNWLHIFQMDWKTKAVSHSAVSLPMATLQNYIYCPDGKTILCVGQQGTWVMAVDIPTKAVRTVFKHKAGKSGFRISPPVMWRENDKVCAVGYFCDETLTAMGDFVVSINPAATGLACYEKMADITKISERSKMHTIAYRYSATQTYFGLKEVGDNIYLYSNTNNNEKNLQYLDKGKRIDSLTAGRDRVLYAIRQADGTSRTCIRDIGSGKVWTIGDGKSNYTYLYMTRDATEILACALDMPHRKMTVWYAHEDDQYRLRPMPGMIDIFPGTIRMSHAGGTLSFFTPTGIFFRRIPKN